MHSGLEFYFNPALLSGKNYKKDEKSLKPLIFPLPQHKTFTSLWSRLGARHRANDLSWCFILECPCSTLGVLGSREGWHRCDKQLTPIAPGAAGPQECCSHVPTTQVIPGSAPEMLSPELSKNFCCCGVVGSLWNLLKTRKLAPLRILLSLLHPQTVMLRFPQGCSWTVLLHRVWYMCFRSSCWPFFGTRHPSLWGISQKTGLASPDLNSSQKKMFLLFSKWGQK